MTAAREVTGTPYLNWAKTRSVAKYNLSTSGLGNMKLSELNVSLEDLEITYGGYGYPPLLEAIATRYRVAPEEVVTTAGTTFANHLAIAALIKPRDEILFEYPTYEPMLSLARYLGADLKRFSRRFEDNFRISLEELERLVTPKTRLIVITNLNNPSMALVDDSTLKQIGQLARRVGARVLVNEVYLETVYEELPRTSFHLGEEFVVTSSLTKAFGLSGLRCGWILAQRELAKRMWLLNDLFAATSVHAGERLSVVAMQQLEGIGARAKQLLDRNRQLLNEFLDTREDLEVFRPQFGTVMFPRVRRGTSDELCQLLRDKYQTTVVPGVYFEMPAHFRIGIAGDTDILIEGLKRLELALDELSRG